MPRNWREKTLFYLRKIIIALGITFLFALLSLFPSMAYRGEARVGEQSYNEQLLYVDSEINSNITYNPFLFPIYWLTGRGQSSYHFVMRSAPKGAFMGMVTWPMLQEIEDDALLILALNAIFASVPYNMIILLAVELLKTRRFYLCLFGGIIGFPIAGLIGSIVSFAASVVLVGVFVPRLKRSKYFMGLLSGISKEKQQPF